MLCYITAAFGLIDLLLGGAVGIIPMMLLVGGLGVANERRWGYVLAAVLAVLNVLNALLSVVTGYALGGAINLLFAVVLAALLLHPQSREYQRIWFH